MKFVIVFLFVEVKKIVIYVIEDFQILCLQVACRLINASSIIVSHSQLWASPIWLYHGRHLITSFAKLIS